MGNGILFSAAVMVFVIIVWEEWFVDDCLDENVLYNAAVLQAAVAYLHLGTFYAADSQVIPASYSHPKVFNPIAGSRATSNIKGIASTARKPALPTRPLRLLILHESQLIGSLKP